MNYKTTTEIVEEYDISRQTLHNWINEGLLPKPKKDFRNWYMWEKNDEIHLSSIITQKIDKNNAPTPSDDDILKISNRRYLGSKQKLLPFIEEVINDNTSDIKTVADIFGGTGVVADLFRKKGCKIIINDILKSNKIIYNTWFGTQKVDYNKIKHIITELNEIKSTDDNYVSINFGNSYFSNENAKLIGEIRQQIENYEINEREKSFLLTSLLYAMDKVANTVGHYDAYRKKMDSFQKLHLKVPELINNKYNEIYNEDANDLVKKIKADLVYIDTPYNSRQYGDAYHLLENIVNWEKPKVTGVAKKMIDRSSTKSLYSTKKAPEAFDELIQNIDAKYILVSYNNMAKKGNGRSNAKISNEEIINSLKKRGTVQVFETPFKVFTTGKTDIENHKELLYLCTIRNEKPKKRMEIIKSPLNYTGGKQKLLKQILPLFPKNIHRFYDVFAGGANVALNVDADNIIINDIEYHVINLFQFIQRTSLSKLLKSIENVISYYNLSNTKKYGYDYYNANSSQGLKEKNNANYLKLRNDYNNGIFIENENIIFYVLLIFAFNNQIRFNASGHYNMPPGKRDFNEKMENKLVTFKKEISCGKYSLEKKDFREIINNITNPNDFVYLDPPYLISTASYNENGGWTDNDENDLLNSLDKLNQRGIRFALSNVLLHKGKENIYLKKWSEKYNVHFLNYDYNNSNYQTKASLTKTIEILVTNY